MDDILGSILNEDSTGNISSSSMSDKERCRNSLVEFVNTYLSNGELDELCSFHYDIAARLEDIVLNKKKERTYTCFVSQRGIGKSFWTSYAFPLWCIAYQHTKNILIVTSEGSLGRQFIIDIRQFIEDNEKFIQDFGDLRGNVIWTTDKIACRNKVCVSTKGSEMATRGVKIFGVRPTVIICDDILSESNSSSPEQRQKLEDWYNKVLMPCGEKYASVFVIGTILNDACLLYKMLNDPQFSDYYTKKYQAVIEFSDSPLWDKWLDIRNDLSNPNRIQDADKLYFNNREEMLKGTKVLWDRYEDTYLYFMKEKQRIGDDAFATEYQCEGLLEESREFKEEWILRNLYTQDELPEITDIYIGLDAAAKAKLRSDDSAIAVVGRGVDKYLYVIETFSRKVPVDQLVDQLLLYCVQYYTKIRRIAIEDVVFQILIKDIAEKKALDNGLYLPFDGIKVPTTQKKELKLRSLVIPIRNGYFKFRKDQRKLLEEMRRFPKGASDNLLDALWISTVGVIGGAASSKFSFGGIETESSRKHKNKQMQQPDWLTKLSQSNIYGY